MPDVLFVALGATIFVFAKNFLHSLGLDQSLARGALRLPQHQFFEPRLSLPGDARICTLFLPMNLFLAAGRQLPLKGGREQGSKKPI